MGTVPARVVGWNGKSVGAFHRECVRIEQMQSDPRILLSVEGLPFNGAVGGIWSPVGHGAGPTRRLVL